MNFKRFAVRQPESYDEFREAVEGAGYTIVEERPLANSTGIQIITKEGPIPTFYHTHRWQVQGKHADECRAKLCGEVPEGVGTPVEPALRAHRDGTVSNGVLLVVKSLTRDSNWLAARLRFMGLEPLVLEPATDAAFSILQQADFIRSKARFGLIVAAPDELMNDHDVQRGHWFAVGMLGMNCCAALVKVRRSARVSGLPQGMETIKYGRGIDSVEKELIRFLFHRADMPVRRRMNDNAGRIIRESFNRSA